MVEAQAWRFIIYLNLYGTKEYGQTTKVQNIRAG